MVALFSDLGNGSGDRDGNGDGDGRVPTPPAWAGGHTAVAG
jgi:hypothetical protein